MLYKNYHTHNCEYQHSCDYTFHWSQWTICTGAKNRQCSINHGKHISKNNRDGWIPTSSYSSSFGEVSTLDASNNLTLVLHCVPPDEGWLSLPTLRKIKCDTAKDRWENMMVRGGKWDKKLTKSIHVKIRIVQRYRDVHSDYLSNWQINQPRTRVLLGAICAPVAHTLEHGANNAKVIGLIPRDAWTDKDALDEMSKYKYVPNRTLVLNCTECHLCYTVAVPTLTNWTTLHCSI